jgi:hypothetical protein
MIVSSAQELAEVFTTITVHLCAGALAFGMGERGLASTDMLLPLVRRRLVEAVAGLRGTRDFPVLQERVLDAERLPVKSMVTAGTLRPRGRIKTTDINKYYGTTGPNYLRAGRLGNPAEGRR